ncbi:hypothetical protein [Lysinibacillus sp. NPDC056232]|uniref:hypothetical protein n=1 Tax=Lysinibacillus sp. NPDC056232 TaxID=3345756 RepID=UPI0035DC8258
MGISVTDETLERAARGTKAKTITSCDNAFVTNIVLAQAAHRTPPGSSALRESEASAANVLTVRKRSVSNKAPSRNGNHPLVLPKSHTMKKGLPHIGSSFHII